MHHHHQSLLKVHEVQNADQLLQPDPEDGFCFVLPMREGKEIEFQPSDVIGYYMYAQREW